MSDLRLYTVQEDAGEEQEITPSSRVESLIGSERDVLKQRLIKCLISAENSDAFSGLSVGLDQLAGSAAVGRGALSSEVLARIRSAEERILATQREDEPLGSALSRIEILGVQEESVDRVRVIIEIYNQAGEAISAEVTG